MQKLIGLLNFETWATYFKYIVKSSHPLILILALISFKRNWRLFLSNPVVRLFCIFIIIDLGVRLFKLAGSGVLSGRYFLPCAFVLTVFAADGLLRLIPRTSTALIKKYPYFTYKRTFIVIFIIVFCVLAGKALMPHFDKPWFYSIKDIVAKDSPKGLKPVIITNEGDPRIGYFAGSELYLLSTNNFSISNRIFLYRQAFSDPKKNLLPGIDNFVNNLKKFGNKNVFVFIYDMNNIAFEKLFSDNNLKFPFKLLKTYKARHGDPVCFYQFEG